MAEIEARIHRVIIEEHPDAHSLELARIGEYRAVVRKGEVQDGDLVAYIPESSILPDGLIADMGLTGKLAGRDHNRVRGRADPGSRLPGSGLADATPAGGRRRRGRAGHHQAPARDTGIHAGAGGPRPRADGPLRYTERCAA